MGSPGAKRTERPQVPSLPKDPTSKVPKIVNDNGVNVNAELSRLDRYRPPIHFRVDLHGKKETARVLKVAPCSYKPS